MEPVDISAVKHQRLHRCTYVSPGPNFAGHVDVYTANSKLMVFQSMVVLMALAKEYCGLLRSGKYSVRNKVHPHKLLIRMSVIFLLQWWRKLEI